MYVPELVRLVKEINKRKLKEWKMQLAIVQNPHVKNPKQLWQELNSADETSSSRNAEFDPVAFEKLKEVSRKNPRIVVK